MFPCPQIALKDYASLSIGNISKDRFWNIWDSEKRKRMLRMLVNDMRCRVCDRKDETINKELDKLMDVNRFILNSREKGILLKKKLKAVLTI